MDLFEFMKKYAFADSCDKLTTLEATVNPGFVSLFQTVLENIMC